MLAHISSDSRQEIFKYWYACSNHHAKKFWRRQLNFVTIYVNNLRHVTKPPVDLPNVVCIPCIVKPFCHNRHMPRLSYENFGNLYLFCNLAASLQIPFRTTCTGTGWPEWLWKANLWGKLASWKALRMSFCFEITSGLALKRKETRNTCIWISIQKYCMI